VSPGGQLEVALRERRPVVETVPDSSAAGALNQLVIPLIAGDEVWGALELDSRLPDAFAPAEVRVLQAMTEAVGRALAVAQLLAELAGAGWESEGYYELATKRSDPHGREVARVVDGVGRLLGLPEGGLRQLYVAGLFHEIGTVCVPPDVLRKPGQLTSEEFATLRPHPLVGERLLGGLPGLADAAAIVCAERERFDGKGYPYGLAGDEIPLSARILHACDAFVAMTTPRPYRRSVSPDIALGELRRHATSQFDPTVVDALGGFVTERH
jgi:HD-GYP domain-containing protein (c-di-GMP phosphodiesterase class II)